MITITLNNIAEILEGLEETIIIKLINRAQFSINQTIYTKNESGFKGMEDKSLFEIRLFKHEAMDAEFGRFHVPEERPFNRNLPDARRDLNLPATHLKIDSYDDVNLTGDILETYHQLIPCLCSPGDDGQYGSSVEHDVYSLQAISRRIHFGAFYVAESKFRKSEDEYIDLIKKSDTESLKNKLTRKHVEDKILERVRYKVAHIQSETNKNVRKIIKTDTVIDFYKNSVIPLTKKGEVLYLLNRNIDK